MLVLPKSWLERWKGQDPFKEVASLEGRVYKKKEGRRTFRFALEGKSYFAKFHCGVGWKEIVKNLAQFRLPVLGAQNEWRAIQRLEALGIRVPGLVGFGKKGWNPARIQSFVITREIPGCISLENLCMNWPSSPPSPELKRALINAVAKIARTVHGNGIQHRDFYICHFLLDCTGGVERIDPNHLIITLIDLHRVRSRNPLPRRWRLKDMAALYFSSMNIGLTRSDLLRFVRVYGNKPLKESFNEDGSFWKQVLKRGGVLQEKYVKKQRSAVLGD